MSIACLVKSELLIRSNTTPKYTISLYRGITKNSIQTFINLLSYENWGTIFEDKNVSTLYNDFPDTYLKTFNTCFPIKKKTQGKNLKPWLTFGIRTSCANKQKMFSAYRISINPNFKAYYKKYCKILSSVISTAKKMHLIFVVPCIMLNSEIIPTRCNNCIVIACWLLYRILL